MEDLKEAINRMKKSINSFFGHAKEFVRAFSEPAKQDPTLEEAIENIEDMTPKQKNDLRNALRIPPDDEINYEFDNGEKPKKEGRKRPTITKTENQVSSVQRIVTRDESNKEIDR